VTISPENRFYLQMALLACALGGCLFLGWYVFGYVSEASAQVSEIQQELAQLEAEQKQVSQISREYEDAKQFIPELDRMLLEAHNKLAFIVLVERLAGSAGVAHVIEAVSGTEPQEQEGVAFNINVSGDFPSVLRFVYLLENSTYYLTMEKLHVTRGAVGQAAGARDDVKAQLFLRVFAR
jgi:outer membrane murein-binding lipoprotein Lpp